MDSWCFEPKMFPYLTLQNNFSNSNIYGSIKFIPGYIEVFSNLSSYKRI